MIIKGIKITITNKMNNKKNPKKTLKNNKVHKNLKQLNQVL